MKRLTESWITEGLLDFEYKKYVLLAYLQHVEGQFNQARLYPHLTELKRHLSVCEHVKAQKDSMKAAFPRTITGINWQALELVYEQEVEDNPKLADIGFLIDYAIPQISKSLERGASVLEEVGDQLQISPVGIVPIRTEEGYLFFQRNSLRRIFVYQYQLALYNSRKERYVKLHYVDQVKVGLGSNVAQVKVSLTKKYKELPNPATYIIESKIDYPLQETMLPVAQRLLLRYLNLA
ncbi:hypothetical protein CLV98_10254 [Dyadobacter jejuensis]|uniref:Uncharacterized protein n=1 Tax=Dyadobacter jejuensis TaxID=1082580 RepID=A0A316ANV2_9BACT|nr:hypothetical protein [Dyadobacter jejuensis]PWJ59222.1 hypothetical protein CLV98_10254 [Dyadobacter jejuensis]